MGKRKREMAERLKEIKRQTAIAKVRMFRPLLVRCVSLQTQSEVWR